MIKIAQKYIWKITAKANGLVCVKLKYKLRANPPAVNTHGSLLPLTSRNVDGCGADGVWVTHADGLVGTLSWEEQ